MERYFSPTEGVSKTAEYQFGTKWDKQVSEGDHVVLFNEGSPDQVIVGKVSSTKKVKRMDILNGTMLLRDLDALVQQVGAADSRELVGFIEKAGNNGFNMEDTIILFDEVKKYKNRDELPAESKDDIEAGIAAKIEEIKKSRRFNRNY